VISTEAFALKNSNLNPFLFADVGTELNGSTLTMLSVLARLGRDPWAEAAKWTNLPRAAAVECLTQCIGKMPLGPRSLAETTATVTRLILLLPIQARTAAPGVRKAAAVSAIPAWIPIAFLFVCVLISLAVNMTTPPAPIAPAAPPSAQVIDHAPVLGSQ
jgi:hypothetical protein